MFVIFILFMLFFLCVASRKPEKSHVNPLLIPQNIDLLFDWLWIVRTQQKDVLTALKSSNIVGVLRNRLKICWVNFKRCIIVRVAQILCCSCYMYSCKNNNAFVYLQFCILLIIQYIVVFRAALCLTWNNRTILFFLTVANKKRTKLTHLAFNPEYPVLIVGDDRWVFRILTCCGTVKFRRLDQTRTRQGNLMYKWIN